ncbi:RING/U-box superfamily protein [Wolffia australiana]
MEGRGRTMLCCNSDSSSSIGRRIGEERSNQGLSVGEADLAMAGSRLGDGIGGGGMLQIIPRLITGAVSGALTGVFAFAGAVSGAVSGALAGRATESGFLRGAGLGAVAGAVLSVEVLKASGSYWSTDLMGLRSPSSMADFIVELIHGRLVRDQFSPAMFTSYRWQISINDVRHDENYDIFGQISPRGLSTASLKKLPFHVIQPAPTGLGGNSVCTICLQEIQVGDTVRSLPNCSHTFHLDCVDKWLIKQPSCPVCRQTLQQQST